MILLVQKKRIELFQGTNEFGNLVTFHFIRLCLIFRFTFLLIMSNIHLIRFTTNKIHHEERNNMLLEVMHVFGIITFISYFIKSDFLNKACKYHSRLKILGVM